MNILIMGGPGAGKGTMSTRIVKKYHVNHISTGDIFRSEIGMETELGLAAKDYIEKGLLVPDEITNGMVKNYLEHLSDKKSGFLLDGYPRTLDQAVAFDKLSGGTMMAIYIVIAMEIPYEALSQPSRQEGICDQCGGTLYQRKDDTVESLNVRLDEYTKQTQPVLDFYEAKGLVKHINANQPIEKVWADVASVLNGYSFG